ncbi:hypothetical protein BDZ91DRAFT_795877 [Kalaharituber pfeilii]|nr:hypothetical protein BDZ91DRAFT_795877 [Kalaharituber pfeilii]
MAETEDYAAGRRKEDKLSGGVFGGSDRIRQSEARREVVANQSVRARQKEETAGKSGQGDREAGGFAGREGTESVEVEDRGRGGTRVQVVRRKGGDDGPPAQRVQGVEEEVARG